RKPRCIPWYPDFFDRRQCKRRKYGDSRRRDAQRRCIEHRVAVAFPGCSAGVQTRDEFPAGTIRLSLRRCIECGNEVGHERLSRLTVRVRSKLQVQWAEFLCVTTGLSEAQSIWRDHRRTDQTEQIVLDRKSTRLNSSHRTISYAV